MSEMTSLERVVAALKHEKPDRVPVIGVIITRALREVGYTPKDSLYKPERMAEAKIAAHEHYGDDGIVAGTDLFLQAEALGAETDIKEHVPIVIHWPLKEDKSALDKMKPFTLEDGRIASVLEEIRLLKDKYDDTVVIGPVVGGPVTTAAMLRGVEPLLMDMVLDPEWVHRLLRFLTEADIPLYKAIAEAGAHAIVQLEPISSNTILSPEQYAEFAMPYQRELFGVLNDLGVVGVNHICADTSLIWEQMVDVGAPAIQIDYPIDMVDCKKRVGTKTTIMGNVDPIDYLLFGSPKEVYDKSVEVIKQTADGSGFVLTPGCDLNPNTPAENILAHVQAAKDTYYDDDIVVHFKNGN